MSTLGPAAKIVEFAGRWEDIDEDYQARVRDFLEHTKRDSREVVGVLPPRQGEATVEKIAANAVMAGCKPEYLPVILAAIEALADPLFNLDSVQATTHPVAPLIV